MPTLTRRHFLAATAGALGAAALGDGFLLEPAAVQVTRHELPIPGLPAALDGVRIACLARSEEHTSELQSQSNLVCRLLLEKKKHSRPSVRRPLTGETGGSAAAAFGRERTSAPRLGAASPPRRPVHHRRPLPAPPC